MTLRFGTDGVRGVAGPELSAELVLALGRAAGRVLPSPGGWVVGRDTRHSGPMLAAALAAGLAAEGADVTDLGVVPTPAVATVAAAQGRAAAVISASHNPFADNGVKLFGAGGRKLDDATEAAVEADLAELVSPGAARSARSGKELGTVTADPAAAQWYAAHVVDAVLEGRRLDGLRVAVDCANGAAAAVAPEVLAATGADVVAVLGADPDGTNINEACGSTDPSGLAAAVRREGADVGLAFDGDADRLIAVDGSGVVVDGDRLLAIFASDLRSRGRLRDDTVVVTVMTNLGFHRAMAAEGIAVHRTGVGDRQVLAALEEGHWSLGGEQSGHIIFPELATTGDGVLAGVALLDALRRHDRPLAGWAAGVMDRVPQILRNVTVGDRGGLPDASSVWAEVAAVESELGADGRVLLRPSGTEPLVRVMVEAPTEEGAAGAVDRLEAALVEALGP